MNVLSLSCVFIVSTFLIGWCGELRLRAKDFFLEPWDTPGAVSQSVLSVDRERLFVRTAVGLPLGQSAPFVYAGSLQRPFFDHAPVLSSHVVNARHDGSHLRLGIQLGVDISLLREQNSWERLISIGSEFDNELIRSRREETKNNHSVVGLRAELSTRAEWGICDFSLLAGGRRAVQYGYEYRMVSTDNTVVTEITDLQSGYPLNSLYAGGLLTFRPRGDTWNLMWCVGAKGAVAEEYEPVFAPEGRINESVTDDNSIVWHGRHDSLGRAEVWGGLETVNPDLHEKENMQYRGRFIHGIRLYQVFWSGFLEQRRAHRLSYTLYSQGDSLSESSLMTERTFVKHGVEPEFFLRRWISFSLPVHLCLESTRTDDNRIFYDMGPSQSFAEIGAALTARGYFQTLRGGRVRIDITSPELVSGQLKHGLGRASLVSGYYLRMYRMALGVTVTLP